MTLFFDIQHKPGNADRGQSSDSTCAEAIVTKIHLLQPKQVAPSSMPHFHQNSTIMLDSIDTVKKSIKFEPTLLLQLVP